jgi:hypothetical protein
VPSLDLRFADNKSLVDAVTGQSLVTFTRASSGTFVGSAGVLQTAATDVPRFDHNPTTGESLGLLVEESRTNLLVQSNGFDTTWANVNSTETAASGTAPDGTNAAWDLKDTVDGAATQHSISQTISFTSGTVYTFTIWAKAGTLSSVSPTLPASAFTSILVTRFDLTSGTVATTPAGTTCTISSFPNGWYRCSMSATATVTASGSCAIRIANSSSSTYQGDGTGTILIWGAQLEAGAFPTSYIPTTTATVTRAADVASITGSAFSSWYRQDEGTVFTEYRDPGVSGTNRTPFAISDGTSGNRIQFFVNGTTTVNNRHIVAGVGNNPGNLSAALNSRNRHAISAAVGSCNAASNGTLATGSSPAAMPVVNRLNIGINGDGSGDYLNAPIARITFWPTRLPNSTLQSITQ